MLNPEQQGEGQPELAYPVKLLPDGGGLVVSGVYQAKPRIITSFDAANLGIIKPEEVAKGTYAIVLSGENSSQHSLRTGLIISDTSIRPFAIDSNDHVSAATPDTQIFLITQDNTVAQVTPIANADRSASQDIHVDPTTLVIAARAANLNLSDVKKAFAKKVQPPHTTMGRSLIVGQLLRESRAQNASIALVTPVDPSKVKNIHQIADARRIRDIARRTRQQSELAEDATDNENSVFPPQKVSVFHGEEADVQQWNALVAQYPLALPRPARLLLALGDPRSNAGNIDTMMPHPQGVLLATTHHDETGRETHKTLFSWCREIPLDVGEISLPPGILHAVSLSPEENMKVHINVGDNMSLTIDAPSEENKHLGSITAATATNRLGTVEYTAHTSFPIPFGDVLPVGSSSTLAAIDTRFAARDVLKDFQYAIAESDGISKHHVLLLFTKDTQGNPYLLMINSSQYPMEVLLRQNPQQRHKN